MLIFVAAEHLSHLVRHRAAPSDARTLIPGSQPPAVTPAEASKVDAYRGMRYQLLRALRAMAKGEVMVVEHKIPEVSRHLENMGRRDALFTTLRNAASWRAHDEIEPVLVPGTAYPRVIGCILLRIGCCAPSEQPHWVPNLRFFLLTATGHELLRKAEAWWSGLTMLERLQAMVLE